MEYAAFVFALFGLMAYLEVESLKKKVMRLERELTETKGTTYANERESLVKTARSCIGQKVNLELKEDHMDGDIVNYGNTKHGSNTILDVDRDWLLVRVDSTKKSIEKLIRMESIERIAKIEKD